MTLWISKQPQNKTTNSFVNSERKSRRIFPEDENSFQPHNHRQTGMAEQCVFEVKNRAGKKKMTFLGLRLIVNDGFRLCIIPVFLDGIAVSKIKTLHHHVITR